MTPDQFALITRNVIAQGDFADFQPTACYPARRELKALTGLPDDVDAETATLNWAARSAEPDEEFLVAFRISADHFRVIRREGASEERQDYHYKAELSEEAPVEDAPKPMAHPSHKKFNLPDPIRDLIPSRMGCIATDRITVDGMPVGYMYRDEPTKGNPDTGWCFFSGDETQEYVDDNSHSTVFALNTICNYDPAIIPYLDSPIGTHLVRIPGTDRFEPG